MDRGKQCVIALASSIRRAVATASPPGRMGPAIRGAPRINLLVARLL